MSVEFIIFSPLPSAELEQVEYECHDRVAAWYAEHDIVDEWGDFYLGGPIPSASEATKMVWLPDDQGPAPARSPKTKQILERLVTIRSAITIERPGNLEIDRMQVSILRFLIDRAGPGLVQLVDALELTEAVAAELRTKNGIPGFEEGDAQLGDHDDHVVTPNGPGEDPPFSRAVRGLIARLRAEGLLEVDPTFATEYAAETLLEALERYRDGQGIGLADVIADALLDVPGVVDLYADDTTLLRVTQEALSDS